jgi:hypothetical protein
MADWEYLATAEWPGVPYKYSGTMTDPLAQAYYDWMVSYYRMNNPGDFDDTGKVKSGSDTDKALDWIADQIDAGVNLYSLSFFTDFLKSYQSYSELYGGTSELDDAYTQANIDYLYAQIQQILNNISQSGQMTEYEQGYLDYLMATLEQQTQGNELQQQELELAKQELEAQKQQAQGQLAMEYNQWLTELKANPATWIERWYAEKQPPAQRKIPLESDWIIKQGPMRASGASGNYAGGWKMPGQYGTTSNIF